MIKTFLILWLSGYAIAHVGYEVGSLRILGKNGLATPWSLFISNGKIVADEKMSGFCPDDRGRVLLFALGKFLVIRDKELVLSSSFDEIEVVKFSSEAETDPLLIHFDGDNVFQLCADKLIGYNSTCHGATDITFAYVPIL
ncbi:hypothetical protein HF325_005697 [Metschnikowia pulcherrima]|uniref:Uncharacterized protein n=1 Tax=Metschnikowia pulcherrima TaxID=27326 RepID=A0A8H7L9I7_9ASCO|nr:hypothetical protein HF325_005697 [Metschnikowia pulcherrima]